LFKELNEALSNYDNDKSIGAIIITGSEKAFAGRYMLYLHLFTISFPVTPSAQSLICLNNINQTNPQPGPTSKKWPL
jgi:hypothetical protein